MAFDPVKDIPNLSGKVILVTGGTNGLGKETIAALSKHSPKHIYFTGRNAASAEKVIGQIKREAPSVELSFIECDQLSLASVARAADAFRSQSSRLDVLICNAGVMATDAAVSKDGYENQFAVNHVAHALLVKKLLPLVEATAAQHGGDARVLFLTSTGYMYPLPGGIAFDTIKTAQDFGPGSQWARYGQSKLANVIYAAELARRHPSVLAVALHPGVVNTDLIGRLKPDEKELVQSINKVIVEPHEGVYNTCWCATADRAKLTNGQVYLPVGVPGEQTKESSDPELSNKLWTWTQEELKAY